MSDKLIEAVVDFLSKNIQNESGPFSYGAKKPRRGSVADLADKKRREQHDGLLHPHTAHDLDLPCH